MQEKRKHFRLQYGKFLNHLTGTGRIGNIFGRIGTNIDIEYIEGQLMVPDNKKTPF